MREAAALLAVAAFWMPAPSAAQVPAPFDPSEEPGRIEGRVTTPQGTGLADVSVTVLGPAARGAVTDVVGRFALPAIEVGPVRLRFERLGYATTTATADVRAGTTTLVEATMAMEAIELDGVDVTVGGGPTFLETNGFYRRSRRGFGQQLTRTALDELRMLEISDAIRRVPGIRLSYDPYNASRVIGRIDRRPGVDGRGCALTVYIDGVRTLDPNLNQVPADWLIAMEVYRGADIPARFRTSENCGVVLLWTRRD